ncbi:MAG: PHP domain-containing protein [Chloroflexi bacterium]|nr:PHP domain-containing protein [Chloroflexota bacterium]
MLKTDMHLHSTFSDGINTPQELVEEAIRLGFVEIAITDHVRKSSDWLDLFSQEINRLKQKYSNKIILHSGIEAKVIDLKGAIDAQSSFFSKVDIVLGAFHRLPIGEGDFWRGNQIAEQKERALGYWFNAMMKLIENENVMIVAHPTAILKRNGVVVPRDLKETIATKAASYGKTFEVNTKYNVPDREFLDLLYHHGVNLVRGSDSHSVEEMRHFAFSPYVA